MLSYGLIHGCSQSPHLFQLEWRARGNEENAQRQRLDILLGCGPADSVLLGRRRMLPRQIPHISASKQGSMYAAPLHISAAISPDHEGQICFRNTFTVERSSVPQARFWTAWARYWWEGLPSSEITRMLDS